jgi:hypothetical protein
MIINITMKVIEMMSKSLRLLKVGKRAMRAVGHLKVGKRANESGRYDLKRRHGTEKVISDSLESISFPVATNLLKVC